MRARRRVDQAERLVQDGAAERLGRHAAHARDQLVQQQHVHVGVHVLDAGRRADPCDPPGEVEQVPRARRRGIPDTAQPLDLEHVTQPARHREKMADGQRATRRYARRQFGEIAAHVVVETQRPALGEHEHRRRHEGLRHRDDVESGARTDGHPVREARQSDVPPRDDVGAADHRHRDAGLIVALRGEAFDALEEVVRTRRGHRGTILPPPCAPSYASLGRLTRFSSRVRSSTPTFPSRHTTEHMRGDGPDLGERSEPDGPPRSASRSPLLYADLTGSTEPATQRDPEHCRALLSAFFARAPRLRPTSRP